MEKDIVVAKLVMTIAHRAHTRRQRAPNLRLNGIAPTLPKRALLKQMSLMRP
jgi:hypothetical protein